MSRRGGLALLWKNGWDVNIQSFSTNHVDLLVIARGGDKTRVTGFYGHPDVQQRACSWELLHQIGGNIGEDWVVGENLTRFWMTMRSRVGAVNPKWR